MTKINVKGTGLYTPIGQPKNKTEAVLKHLMLNKKGITSLEAIHKWAATRLSAIIFCLREQGYPIISTEETGKDMFGRTCRWTRYRMAGDKFK